MNSTALLVEFWGDDEHRAAASSYLDRVVEIEIVTRIFGQIQISRKIFPIGLAAKDAVEEFRNSDDSTVILRGFVNWDALGR